ncbi:MAG: hypothetical protein KA712_17210 [Myxococcales bacterium]|nr:hypothetical protein [Myxococcales bacterium]
MPVGILTLMDFVMLVHAAATLAMTGLIWFVQLVHYPLFAFVGEDAFARYEAHHQTRTTWIVAPLMLAELATAVLLVIVPPAGVSPLTARVALGLLALVWLSTAAWQVPLHRRLARGFDAPQIRTLVRSNWLRTLAWTARAALVLGGMLPL